MNFKSTRILVIILALVVFGLSAASAKEDPARRLRGNIADGPQFELFVSALTHDLALAGTSGEKSGASLGLRGSFHLAPRFALEGSVSKFEDSRIFDDVWLADLSAKYYVKNGGRTGIYVLGGGGAMLSSELDTGETMVHLGVGVEVLVGQHLYLRPEVRGRWFTDYLRSDATLGDLSLGIGWRF